MSTSRTFIACLLFEPFALWHAERGHPHLPVAVVEGKKILLANPEARRAGVQPGLPLHGATSRCPDLHTEEHRPARLNAEWAAMVESLYLHSPKIEPLGQGRVLLTVTEATANLLADHYHARVGLAASREFAVLAALAGRQGRCNAILPGAEPVALRALPLRVLRGVGLSCENQERLNFLGLQNIGDLLRWSKAQQAAFLGADHQKLAPYLHGKGTTKIQSHRPAVDVTVSLGFDAPVYEPHEWEHALKQLVTEARAALGARTAQRVAVRAFTAGGGLESVREAKGDLRDERVLLRLARFALDDTGAAALGIERLQLRLTGVQQAAKQLALWPSVRELDAVDAVLRRFPHGLVKIVLQDSGAYAWDHKFTLVDWVTGEARPGKLAPLRVGTSTPAALLTARR